MPHRHTWLITAVIGLALLAGCGSDPTPLYADPSSPSAPTSSAPRTTPAPIDPSQETPQDFIKRWFQAGDALQNTGDSDTFDALSLPSCGACRRLRTTVVGYYSAGGFVKVDPAILHSIRPHGRNKAFRQYLVLETSPPTTIKARAAAKVATQPRSTATLVVTVKRVDDRWRVYDFTVRAS